jgi:hypothetical protein
VNGIPSLNNQTDLNKWPLAVGDVISSLGDVLSNQGRLPVVIINNRAFGWRLQLNFADWQHPTETLLKN